MRRMDPVRNHLCTVRANNDRWSAPGAGRNARRGTCGAPAVLRYFASSRSILHLLQLPGLSEFSSGCMGQ